MRMGRGSLCVLAGAVLLPMALWCQEEAPPAEGPPAAQARFMAALVQGNVEEARAALQMGADPNALQEEESPPVLAMAAMFGNPAMVRMLLEGGCRVQGPGEPGQTALGMALMMSNPNLVQAFVKKLGESEHLPSGQIPSLGRGYEEIAGMLLDAGVDPNRPIPGMGPPIYFAVFGGQVSLVKLLLEKGARADVRENTGETPLLIAATVGQEAIVRLLLPHETGVDARDSKGNTALLLAACQMELEVHNAMSGDFGTSDDKWLAEAMRGTGFAGTERALLEAGADPNAANKRGVTPLMAAAACGGSAVLDALLKGGANVHLTDERGRTALLVAAQFNQLPAVELLLKSGADPKAVAADGTTAMALARAKANPEMVKLLQTFKPEGAAPPDAVQPAAEVPEKAPAPPPPAKAKTEGTPASGP